MRRSPTLAFAASALAIAAAMFGILYYAIGLGLWQTESSLVSLAAGLCFGGYENHKADAERWTFRRRLWWPIAISGMFALGSLIAFSDRGPIGYAAVRFACLMGGVAASTFIWLGLARWLRTRDQH